ncbi:MAG: DUF4296 domain-containing protein [Bacteroidales bacterium]|nr:DUF4296 domain-containing protein [Bacteroidales bacterium]
MQRVPDYVIERDSMVDILADLHVIEGIIAYENSLKPATPKYATKYYSCYFEMNNINRHRFDTSLVYYYSNYEDIAKNLNDEVIIRLMKMEGDLQSASQVVDEAAGADSE